MNAAAEAAFGAKIRELLQLDQLGGSAPQATSQGTPTAPASGGNMFLRQFLAGGAAPASLVA